MYFEIFTGKDGQFYFNFKNSEDKVVVKSEGYTTTASRDNGIESVKTNGTSRDAYVADDNHFNIKAKNGQVIATSMNYNSTADLEAAIEYVIANVANAPIKDRA